MKTTVDNIPDNKSVTFTVSSREEIPVEFRDKKIYEEEGVEKEVDKTFLGIPIGKKTVTGKTYSYDVTGKEMREMLGKRQGEKTEAEFEQEFDGAQKAEEPSVGKEVMRKEPAEKSLLLILHHTIHFTNHCCMEARAGWKTNQQGSHPKILYSQHFSCRFLVRKLLDTLRCVF